MYSSSFDIHTFGVVDEMPDWKFFGKIGKLGKIRKVSKRMKKAISSSCISKLHLAKFHEQIMIFDKVKGYLVILEFRRA